MKAVKTSNDRVVYFDYLRVFAIIAVVFLHVAADKWSVVNANGFEWQAFNIYDSIARWGVSVFVMISGALFLSKETPIKKLYKKYILRMLIVFLVWSVIYAWISGETIGVSGLVSVINGYYHMWFIPMIVGLYMCVPLIRPIVKKAERMDYFLLLALIFAFVIPEITKIVSVFGGVTTNKIMGATSLWISNMNIKMVLGFTGLFILGYYLEKKKLKKKHRLLIYAGGVLGAISTIVLSILASLKNQSANVTFYDTFTLNVLLQAIAVFTWFKYRNYKNEKVNRVFKVLAKLSFGVYLVHPLVLLKLAEWTHLTTLSFNAVVSVPAIATVVIAISFCISAVLAHIPFVKKYFV